VSRDEGWDQIAVAAAGGAEPLFKFAFLQWELQGELGQVEGGE
jgi:hypothetical protein